MGWYGILVSDKEISMKEIREIVDDLPQNFRLGYTNWNTSDNWKESSPIPENGWGWSAIADIKYPEGRRIVISGNSNSLQQAKPMALYFQRELQKRGHQIMVNFDW